MLISGVTSSKVTWDAHANLHRRRVNVDDVGDHAGAVVQIDNGVDVGHLRLEALMRNLVDYREGVNRAESCRFNPAEIFG